MLPAGKGLRREEGIAGQNDEGFLLIGPEVGTWVGNILSISIGNSVTQRLQCSHAMSCWLKAKKGQALLLNC